MRCFLDTNVLAYSVDAADPKRRKRAREVLASFEEGKRVPVLSSQILQEFYVVATRKLGIEPLAAKDLVRSLQRMQVVLVDGALIEEAVDCSILNRLSFWDALVVVSAESAHCETLLSEDLTHGQVIRGVRIENPFRLSRASGDSA